MSGSSTAIDWLIELLRQGVFLALWVSAPAVLAALLAGFVVSVLQAATQISEPSLPFAPKVAAAVVALALSSPWIVDRVHEFTVELWQLLPHLGRG